MKNKTYSITPVLLYQDSSLRVILKPNQILKTPSGSSFCRKRGIVFEIAVRDLMGGLQWSECEEDYVLPDLSTPEGWREHLKIAEGVVDGLNKVREIE